MAQYQDKWHGAQHGRERQDNGFPDTGVPGIWYQQGHVHYQREGDDQSEPFVVAEDRDEDRTADQPKPEACDGLCDGGERDDTGHQHG